MVWSRLPIAIAGTSPSAFYLRYGERGNREAVKARCVLSNRSRWDGKNGKEGALNIRYKKQEVVLVR
ncbi:hypothetical protein SOASR030_27860 [Leminorella grimontii]|uniref:Uncharacterized protein n=1 Tax=Leminorella grimontii TaxID=82981 RepID=A0AAV5N6I8_9GAMM|nr:hypothetical protein SOASR030_27860 [Leminorella grimontii]VFS61954.1 Uncharacterised protein [Leminorella grimontii]